ncbi:MAG: SIMPL domain-containing protein [Turicibacter sp.]
MKNTLTVKGTGTATLPPNFIKILITLESRDVNYEETLAKAGIQLQQLRECLSPEGFAKDEIKTMSFNVDTEYESVRDKEGNYTRVFIGYVCRQTISIGFDMDNKRLAGVIKALSQCLAKPEFSIQYELKDETELKDMILKRAVENATHRAQTLAEAASIQLGEILSIDYSEDTLQFERRNFMLSENSVQMGAAMIDIQPDDIKASDFVTVVWSI